MGKKAGAPSTQSKLGDNITTNREALEPFAKAIHDELRDMEAAKGAFMSRIKELYNDAHEDLGISKKVLRSVIGEQRKLVSILKGRRKLEEGERNQHEQISAALGEFAKTALGLAALEGIVD